MVRRSRLSLARRLKPKEQVALRSTGVVTVHQSAGKHDGPSSWEAGPSIRSYGVLLEHRVAPCPGLAPSRALTLSFAAEEGSCLHRLSGGALCHPEI